MQELHTSRACSLPFQEACLLWKCFVNDWSEVMAEARPGPDDALRLQVRFCMLFKCVLCSAPNPDHALSCRHASACFQAHAVPLAASAAGHAQQLPDVSGAVNCVQDTQLPLPLSATKVAGAC